MTARTSRERRLSSARVAEGETVDCEIRRAADVAMVMIPRNSPSEARHETGRSCRPAGIAGGPRDRR